MRYTENLRLKLPGPEDPVEVKDLTDNFEKLDESAGGFKVGDTLTTYRTDLGNEWLLCNGDALKKDRYPELAALCPGFDSMSDMARPDKTLNAAFVESVARDPNSERAAMVLGIYVRSGSSYSIVYHTFFSNDGFNTYHEDPDTGTAASVFYANGYWYSWKNTGLKVKTLWNSDNYTTLTIPTVSGVTPTCSTVAKILYINGYYYMVLPKTLQIIRSSSYLFTNPSLFTVPKGSATASDYFYQYANGYHLFIGISSKKLHSIIYSKQIEDGYTGKTLTNSHTATLPFDNTKNVQNMLYVPETDRYYFVGVDTTSKALVMFYIRDPATYSTVYKISLDVNGVTGANLGGFVKSGPIRFKDSIVVTFSYNDKNCPYDFAVFDLTPSSSNMRLALMQDGTLKASQYAEGNIPERYSYDCQPIGGSLVFAGSCVEGSTTNYCLIRIPFYAVPEIALNGAYTYIKAK